MMRLTSKLLVGVLLMLCGGGTVATAATPIYLWEANMDVTLGASMAPEPFANVSTANSLINMINLPTATEPEVHSQSSHVWVSGGPLEVDFDLLTTYDLVTLHFWNYYTEQYDVDNIAFTFYDESLNQIGAVQNIAPSVGTNIGGETISPEEIPLAVNGVRYINAVFTGSNTQVDFNNIGFTAVPEPASFALLGVAGLLMITRRR